MRGLLKKNLLWFSLAMVLIVLAIFVTVIAFENGPLFSAVRSLVRTAVTLHGQQTVHLYEREGAAVATNFLRELATREDIRMVLFDQQAQPLTATMPWSGDNEMAALIAKALQTEVGVYRISLRMTRVAIPVRIADGKIYCLAGELPASYIRNWRLDSHAFIWRFLAGVLTAVVVCYWLARSLTKPIVQLQQATRRIAAGDWAARVSPQLEKRNDEIADLAQDFNHMADRVTALLEAQRRLLGDISHELRSPLTRLNIALALARQRTGHVAQVEHDRIEREAERLNEMIGQLLALARVENEALQTGYESINLPHLLEKIAADADFEARTHQRRVTLACEGDAIVYGPPALLRSAIENIVRNAVRYTADDTEVRMELLRETSAWLIRVTDHGPGVPHESLDQLFQPFYRVSAARERDSGGTGLGLAITARAASLLGGSVKASNQLAGGLCVEFRLPFHAPTA